MSLENGGQKGKVLLPVPEGLGRGLWRASSMVADPKGPSNMVATWAALLTLREVCLMMVSVGEKPVLVFFFF